LTGKPEEKKPLVTPGAEGRAIFWFCFLAYLTTNVTLNADD
jgi:hypothetical protein